LLFKIFLEISILISIKISISFRPCLSKANPCLAALSACLLLLIPIEGKPRVVQHRISGSGLGSPLTQIFLRLRLRKTSDMPIRY